MKRLAPWATLLLLNAFAFGMLGLYQTGRAGSPPFANTTESRLEMVEQLKDIRDLLKEQNAAVAFRRGASDCEPEQCPRP